LRRARARGRAPAGRGGSAGRRGRGRRRHRGEATRLGGTDGDDQQQHGRPSRRARARDRALGDGDRGGGDQGGSTGAGSGAGDRRQRMTTTREPPDTEPYEPAADQVTPPPAPAAALSDLSVTEFLTLSRAGFLPRGLVIGVAVCDGGVEALATEMIRECVQ